MKIKKKRILKIKKKKKKKVNYEMNKINNDLIYLFIIY